MTPRTKKLNKLLGSGSLKAQFPGTSQPIGKRAAHSARCRASSSSIRLRFENSHSSGRHARRSDFNPPGLGRDPEKLSGCAPGIAGDLSSGSVSRSEVRRSSRAGGCAGVGAVFRRRTAATGRPKQAGGIRSGDQFFIRSGFDHCAESGCCRGETDSCIFKSNAT